MGAKSERRSLYYEDNEEFDPTIIVDVNEYLIEEWPTLTLKNRTSVWSLCQNDEDFDFDSIYEQIDEWVFTLAEQDPDVNLGEDDTSGVGFKDEDLDDDEDDEDYDEDDYDDEDDSLDGYLIFDIVGYLSEKYPNITEEQLFAVSDHMNDEASFSWEPLCNYMDSYVKQYASKVDKTIDLTEISNESE